MSHLCIMMTRVRVAWLLLLRLLSDSPAASGSKDIASDISALLESTGSDFEVRWKHTAADEPLLPINLDDVELWMKQSGQVVRKDDVELFGLPPSSQHGQGGSFNSAPGPVAVKGRLQTVRKEFGAGRALVINSLHTWCPKAAKLAAALREQIGLPVDVYMYLTPPYSHSYGLHSDVMDAFMVQLVGSKHWKACENENCTDVDTKNGDVLYLPMGAKHSAWTSDELSAHLTVNVERQFYVWGSVLQAMATRLLLPGGVVSQLDRLQDMRAFGMEGEEDESKFVEMLQGAASKLPGIMHMPKAVLRYTRTNEQLTGASLVEEFGTFLRDMIALKLKGQFAVRWRDGQTRKFNSVTKMLKAIEGESKEKTLSALDWLAKLIKKSVVQMHEQHARQNLPKLLNTETAQQQLGALATARAEKLRSKKSVITTKAEL